MKFKLFLLLVLFSTLLKGQVCLPVKLKLSFINPSFNGYNFNHQPKSFLNDNLNFSNFENSLSSFLKISGEIIAGGATGYGCIMLMKNLFEPDKSIEGNWIGHLIQYSLIWIGVTKGTSLGVYSLGKILGDEGSYTNTYFFSVITSGIFYLVSGVFTKHLDNRLRIAMVGLPIGAVIGFNTRDLFELFD